MAKGIDRLRAELAAAQNVARVIGGPEADREVKRIGRQIAELPDAKATRDYQGARVTANRRRGWL